MVDIEVLTVDQRIDHAVHIQYIEAYSRLKTMQRTLLRMRGYEYPMHSAAQQERTRVLKSCLFWRNRMNAWYDAVLKTTEMNRGSNG